MPILAAIGVVLAIWIVGSCLLGPLIGRLLRRNRHAHTTRTNKTTGGPR